MKLSRQETKLVIVDEYRNASPVEYVDWRPPCGALRGAGGMGPMARCAARAYGGWGLGSRLESGAWLAPPLLLGRGPLRSRG